MTVWIQQQIVPSVLPGPASSLQKRQSREREREKGKQGGRERLLAHSVTTMRLSAALSREHGLPGSACKWLQLPSIRSPSAPIIQQMPLPKRRLLWTRLLSGAAMRRGRGGPCQPPEPRPLVLSLPVSPTTAPAAHYITAGGSLLPAPCAGDAAPSRWRQAMLLSGEGSSVA